MHCILPQRVRLGTPCPLDPMPKPPIEHLSFAIGRAQPRRCLHIPGDEAVLLRIRRCRLQREKRVSYEKREHLKDEDEDLQLTISWRRALLWREREKSG